MPMCTWAHRVSPISSRGRIGWRGNLFGFQTLTPHAFSVPTSDRQGTEGRNDITGFGFTQADLSLGRLFTLGDRLRLQFRADAFNALNHPNFTNPSGYI